MQILICVTKPTVNPPDGKMSISVEIDGHGKYYRSASPEQLKKCLTLPLAIAEDAIARRLDSET